MKPLPYKCNLEGVFESVSDIQDPHEAYAWLCLRLVQWKQEADWDPENPDKKQENYFGGTGVYFVFGDDASKDLELIRKASNVFGHVSVVGSYGAINEGLRGVPGVSIRSGSKGDVEGFLNNGGATSWIVQRGAPADLVRRVNYPKYFIQEG